MVELLVANEKVAGSNLVSRSKFRRRLISDAAFVLSQAQSEVVGGSPRQGKLR